MKNLFPIIFALSQYLELTLLQKWYVITVTAMRLPHQPSILRCRLVFLLLMAGIVSSPPSSAKDIVALCIGNDAYKRAEDVLDTPVADATLMKQTFEALPGGADVILLTDANREGIVIALNSLAQKSKGAKLVVVYYSGHGLEGQPDGFNKPETFLLPVEAEIPDVNYLPTRAVGLQVVLEALQKCPVTARAVILDCCRHGAPKATSALAGSTKSFGDIDESVKTALGSAVLPEATLVAFATSPGRKAAAFLKQSDTNSPFTRFLSESLQTGVGNLRDLVEVAAERTEEATGRRQVPYVTYTGAASAIRQIVFRKSVAPGLLTTPGNSLDMAAMRAHLAAAEKARQEALRNGGIEGLQTGELREFGGIEMVWCPPGEFTMGNPDRGPYYYPDAVPHLVTLTKGFWLAKTEATQRQWAAVMGSNPSKFKQENSPVDSVSWDDAQGYLTQMNRQYQLPSGWTWSLPTEAQWEYACRGGRATQLDAVELDQMAWHSVNAGSKTNPVGMKQGNDWGLHDMHGNVCEWCSDYYGTYASGPVTDPSGATTGLDRVLRGGSWFSDTEYFSAAFRSRSSPSAGNFVMGLRLAISYGPDR